MKNKHQDISLNDHASEVFQSFAKMKTLVVSFIVLAMVIAEASSLYVDFKNCASRKYALPLKVAINPCTKQPCTLHPGKKASIAVVVKPLVTIRSGTLELYGIHWPGIKFPLSVPNPDLCHGYGARCPMIANSRVVLSIHKTLPTFVPMGSYQLQAVMKDQLGRMVMCGTINVNIGWSVKLHLEKSRAIFDGIKD